MLATVSGESRVSGRHGMTRKSSGMEASGRARLRSLLFVVGILLLAANLRPALTGVAPLIGEIRADTGISHGAAGLLTTLPLLAFALLSPVAPRVARLLVLAAGILLRWVGTVAALFLGTAILGAAISFGNVLMPGLVKREFPEKAGL